MFERNTQSKEAGQQSSRRTGGEARMNVVAQRSILSHEVRASPTDRRTRRRRIPAPIIEISILTILHPVGDELPRCQAPRCPATWTEELRELKRKLEETKDMWIE